MSQLIQGDCLIEMAKLPPASVHLILCDLPYGTSACKWDAVIPFDRLWTEYRRVLRKWGTVALTASQPFTSALAMSNISWLKYAWVWHKSKAMGFFDVAYRPLKAHEDILIFSEAGCATGSNPPMGYHPQGLIPCHKRRTAKGLSSVVRTASSGGGTQTQTNWPQSVLAFDSESKPTHPTQKPVALMEYLIRTYTLPGQVVLDNCMGSGTTGVAAVKTYRKFIGVELDGGYFEIAQRRIAEAEDQLAARAEAAARN